ncbi:MAG TPA: DUF6445 family protein [Methylotenera sp.]|nr:DUF6445 family protein [Methylotenera sp.]
MNLYPVTIIENFYEKPEQIRKFALSQKFSYCKELPHIDYVYPGGRTQDLSNLDKVLFDKICTKLVSVFHNSEHDMMRWLITTSFQSVSGEYDQGVIHTDNNTVFACVLYLTPEAPLSGGTSLYKKNNTFDEDKYQQALVDNDKRFRAGEIAMDTSYHSMFDEIVRVNNVYNTLIIYEGRHFHAANEFFGKTLEDSRLAQVFFVSKIDAQKQSVFPISRVNAIKI